jgi:hypothetical protein
VLEGSASLRTFRGQVVAAFAPELAETDSTV